MDVENQILLLNLVQLYQKSLPDYSSAVLKVVDKTGNLVDFKLNPLQQKLHDVIEQQKRDTGKVRVIVLKSRKLGMSTYVAARNIHNTVFSPHKRAAVITHVANSTEVLFKIYKRFFENLPEFLKPTKKKDNAKELVFDDLDSSIIVATAGAAQGGRGDTINFLHASEIGFWPNAAEISAGLMQAVPDLPGSEIIVESTPNGVGDLFHSLWVEAVNGENGYIPVFFGWKDDPDCSLPVPDDFQIKEDEKDYAALWDLTPGQVLWRRQKIKQIGEEKFRQEYPLDPAEAFRMATADSFIHPDAVLKARKSQLPTNEKQPLILGVDVARSGKDASCVVWRRGRNIIKYQKYYGLKADELSYKIIEIIRADKPAKINVDGTGGYGTAVIDFLRDKGFDAEEINFSSRPFNNDRYGNRRAEIYGELRDWLEGNVSLPDDDEIESDLTSFSYKFRGDKLMLEDKGEVKKRIKRSPDIGDAIALCFAIPLNQLMENNNQWSVWNKLHEREPDYDW